MKHYGFTYQTPLFIWNKTRKGKPASLPGSFTNSSAEMLLVGTRGNYHKLKRENAPKYE